MDHSQIDELISNMLKNGLIYDKPYGTSYFITEAKKVDHDHEKVGDKTDANIGNKNCFARCSNPSSPYKDTDCPTKEPEIITDLSTPQIKATEKPKHNHEVLENNLISLKAEMVSLKEFISRDEVKHLIEDNNSKTAIIKTLLENINHYVTHSFNTFNSLIQQNDFT